MDDPFANLPDSSGPHFVARFSSTCEDCGGTIHEGDLAQFVDDEFVVHVNCPKPEPVRKACPICWLVHGTHQEDCDG